MMCLSLPVLSESTCCVDCGTADEIPGDQPRFRTQTWEATNGTALDDTKHIVRRCSAVITELYTILAKKTA